jgi:hypothetical protein
MSIRDKSTFFFRYNQTVPKRTVCVSLSGSDKVSLIGDNHNVINVIRNCWAAGIQEEFDYYNSWQFKLKGNPWTEGGSSSIYACFMMLSILSGIESFGSEAYIKC